MSDYIYTGPTSGPVGEQSIQFAFDPQLLTVVSGDTVTISDGGAGGVFQNADAGLAESIGSITLTAAIDGTIVGFWYTPGAPGVVTFTFTNGQGWSNPAPQTYTATGGNVGLDLNQQTGDMTTILVAKEASWGIVNPGIGNGDCREVPITGGESLDQNVSIYRSNLIRGGATARTRNPSTRGTQRPGGGLPMEVAAYYNTFFLWALLGGTCTTVDSATAAQSEKQVITLVNAGGGTFTITFEGQTTGNIAYNANAAAVQTALEALSNVAAAGADVTVAGSAPNWTVSFVNAGAYGKTNVPMFEIDTTLLTGTGARASVVVSQYAVPTGFYKHTFKGTNSATLPSFTLEKQFLGLDTIKGQRYTGCRMGQGSYQFNIDANATVSYDLMARKAEMVAEADFMNDGFTNTAAPLLSTFTSIQCMFVKDDVEMAAAQSLSLTINNALYGDASFRLGSPYRQALKAGTREVGGNGTFMFIDTELYELANQGTMVEGRIACEDATGRILQFRMPQVQFLPNGTSPKVQNDGPLDQTADYEAFYDDTLGSDVEVTVINQDASAAFIWDV